MMKNAVKKKFQEVRPAAVKPYEKPRCKANLAPPTSSRLPATKFATRLYEI
jgi:hypothetical protein